jgi:phage-related protein
MAITDIYTYVQDFLNLIKSLIDFIVQAINLIWTFISSLFGTITAMLNLVTGFLTSIMSINPTAVIIFGIIVSAIGYVLFATVWNIIADIEILGVKLPKLPL